jgi:hypothetical protein
VVAGAGLKIVYDLALWSACRHAKPPEELGQPSQDRPTAMPQPMETK